jgi:Mrp family chromosome partitioning ATPase
VTLATAVGRWRLLEPQRDAPDPRRGFFGRLLGRSGAASSQRIEGTCVAFASGKGGTGKSFLATNVAIALHRAGKRVALVDCDFGLANAHLLLGVHPRHTLQHFVDGSAAIEDVARPLQPAPP